MAETHGFETIWMRITTDVNSFLLATLVPPQLTMSFDRRPDFVACAPLPAGKTQEVEAFGCQSRGEP